MQKQIIQIIKEIIEEIDKQINPEIELIKKNQKNFNPSTSTLLVSELSIQKGYENQRKLRSKTNQLLIKIKKKQKKFSDVIKIRSQTINEETKELLNIKLEKKREKIKKLTNELANQLDQDYDTKENAIKFQNQKLFLINIFQSMIQFQSTNNTKSNLNINEIPQETICLKNILQFIQEKKKKHEELLNQIEQKSKNQDQIIQIQKNFVLEEKQFQRSIQSKKQEVDFLQDSLIKSIEKNKGLIEFENENQNAIIEDVKRMNDLELEILNTKLNKIQLSLQEEDRAHNFFLNFLENQLHFFQQKTDSLITKFENENDKYENEYNVLIEKEKKLKIETEKEEEKMIFLKTKI
ncbi:dynein regulatory complex protein [Anaeramoeba ignava]|uniref:Dynein regulatory complex protein n=1 Tax=Anaeramoeba ignava TaxID=1746090 RepID=A0A9Q0RDG5_ANAIG|nr:dynein regulatory complex protein [Anaeramoeba ignava]